MTGQRAELSIVVAVLIQIFVLPWNLAAQDASETGEASRPVDPPTGTMSAEEQAAIEEEAAHDALRALRKIYEQAINENNLELLRPHLDDEVSGIMVTNDLVTDFESLEAYWQSIQELIGEGGAYTTALEPELSWIHGDVAVAKGGTKDHVVMPGGKEYRFRSNFTAILVNRDGEWKIRRMQGTMNPVDNEFVAAAVRGATLSAGGIAGVAGLLLGLVLGRIWSRSRAKTA